MQRVPQPSLKLSLLASAVLLALTAACGGGGGSGGNSAGTTATPVTASSGPAAGTGSTEIKSVSAVAQTRDNTLVVDESGVLWGRGSNVGGALGIGTARGDVLNLTGTGDEPGANTALRFVRIASANTHSLALTADRTLYGWGDNSAGQLGVTADLQYRPARLAADVIAIAVGETHSLYVTADGSLYAMGDNQSGQLGTGDTARRTAPTLVGTGFSDVATGNIFSAAIKDDGTLWTWGGSVRGELGNSGTTGYAIRQLVPAQIGSGFASVFAGSERAFAIRRATGELIGWGDNLFGQLGVGRKGDFTATPVLVGSGYSSIAVGAGHTIARRADGTVAAWGNNGFNQLALGADKAEALTPTDVPGTYDFATAGGGNTLLATRGGMLKAYGASFPRGEIDFPYDPDAGKENTSSSSGSGGSSGGSGGSGGSSGGSASGGSASSGKSDALNYTQVNYKYTCKPVGGIVNSGTFPVSDGPCKTQQQAYGTAMSCNQVDAAHSFKYVGKPYYQCLVDNSSGDYKSQYKKYLDYFSK